MRVTRRCGVEIRLFSGRRGAAPYDLTYIIRRHGAEFRLPSPVGEGGPSETVDEESLTQMIFVFFRFTVSVRKILHFRAIRESPLRAKIETASDSPLNEGENYHSRRAGAPAVLLERRRSSLRHQGTALQ